MQSICIGRQPIIDSHLELCAYEVLYKGSKEVLSRYSSASIVNNVLNKFGTQALLGGRRAFVKIDEKFLLHDIIFSIPNSFFIFSLLADVKMSERVVERIEQLKAKNYSLGIDKLSLNEDVFVKYKAVLENIDFVKLDVKNSQQEKLKELIQRLKSKGMTVVADNVMDNSAYEEAKSLGCDWFQGYFFAEPKILENAKYEPSNMAVLKLYNLLMQDVNIDEITKEFENNPEITVQLLQFINSGAFHFRQKISTIHHILTLVGRIPLGQWLMLMIYSKSVSKEKQSPLMLMVKHRTELMENILKVVKPNAGSNQIGEAYFVGVISLMDTLFSMKLEDILEHINISDEVKSAVLYDKGLFGEIYKLVRDIEEFKTESNYDFEKKYSLQVGTIEGIVFQAMRDLNSFETPNN